MIISDSALMEDVLDNAQIGLWMIQMDEGQAPRMYGNKTMMRLLGMNKNPKPEECYEWWYSRVEPEHYPVINEAVEQMTKQYTAEVSYTWNHPTWGRIFVRCGGTRDMTYSRGVNLRGYHQNISKVAQLEREKEELVKFKEAMLQSLKNLFYTVWILDLRENTIQFLHTNLPYGDENYASMTIEQVLQRAGGFIHPEHRERFHREISLEQLKTLMKQGESKFVGEYQRIIGDQYRWVTVTIYLVQDSPTPRYAILAVQDVDRQKKKDEKSKEALQEAYDSANRANQAKSEFLSRMSHDIRTPLNAIMGMTTLARVNLEDRDCVKECLENIRDAGESLRALTDSVLDVSKIESGIIELNQKVFCIEKLLKKVVMLLRSAAEAKDQKLCLEVDKLTHTQVIGDENRLEKVFVNILSNSVKYTMEGGSIRITAVEMPSLQEEYGRYQFQFKDNGIGMDQGFLDKIFEPFARADHSVVRKTEGSGLGMSIAHNIIKMMNGELRVQSRPGEGSCFTVDVNLKYVLEEGPKEYVDEADILQNTKLAPCRILLAEDNELNVEIVSSMLEMLGVECVVACDGVQAVKVYKQYDPGYFNMVLMDIQMPHMNGYEAAKAIRQSGRADSLQIPVIALTANAFQEDVRIATEVGMNGHVAKPVDARKLVETLKEFIPQWEKN